MFICISGVCFDFPLVCAHKESKQLWIHYVSLFLHATDVNLKGNVSEMSTFSPVPAVALETLGNLYLPSSSVMHWYFNLFKKYFQIIVHVTYMHGCLFRVTGANSAFHFRFRRFVCMQFLFLDLLFAWDLTLSGVYQYSTMLYSWLGFSLHHSNPTVRLAVHAQFQLSIYPMQQWPIVLPTENGKRHA